MWTRKTPRYYVGNFGGIVARLVCPDTPTLPEQHDQWLLMLWEGEQCVVVGNHGDEVAEVLRAANASIREAIAIALRVLG